MKKQNNITRLFLSKLALRTKNALNNSKGLTLIELITAITITVMMGTIVTGIVLTSSALFMNRQMLNEQHILIDYIDMVLSQEIRNSTDLHFGTSEPGCTVIDSTGDIVIRNGDYLFSSNVVGSHTVRLEFHTTDVSVDNLYVTIYIDEGLSHEKVETINFKMLNFALNGISIPVISTPVSILSYN